MASPTARRAFLSAALFLFVVVAGPLLSGCATAPATALPDGAVVLADPGRVVAEPADQVVTIRIDNPTPVARELAGWRIEGDDWLGFQIVSDPLPKLVPPRASVTVDVRVDAPAFAVTDPSLASGQQGYAHYREGRATLRYEVDDLPHEVSLAFAPARSADTRRWSLAAIIALFALGLVALGRGLIESALGDAPHRGLSLVSHARSPAATRLTAIAAMLAILLGLASIPVGLPLCEAPGDLVGPAAQARCAIGLGGNPLRVLTEPPPVTWLCALLLLSLVGFAAGAEVPRAALARGLTRLSVFVALSLAVCVAANTFDVDALSWPATPRLAAGDRPPWAALVHPLGAVLALWSLATYLPAPDEAQASLPGRRWIDMLAAATYTSVWLGGGALPTSVLAFVGPAGAPVAVTVSVASFVGTTLLVSTLILLGRRHQLQLVGAAPQLEPDPRARLRGDPADRARIGALLVVGLACAAYIVVAGGASAPP